MFGPDNWDEPPPGQRDVLQQAIDHPLASDYVRAEAKWLLALGYDGAQEKALMKEIALEVPDSVRGARELGTVAAQELLEGGPDACRAYLYEVLPQAGGALCEDAANEILMLLDQPGLWSDPTGVPPLMLALRAHFYWTSQNEHAGEALQALIEQYPDIGVAPLALESLADYLYGHKDYARAIEVYAQLADTCPAAPEAPTSLRMIGICYRHLGEADKAFAAYQETIDRYPGSHMAAVSRCSMGQILEEDRGDTSGAMEAYRQVVDQYPGTDQARYAEEGLKRLSAGQ